MIKLSKLVNEIFDTNLLENHGDFKIFCDLDGVLVDFQKGVKQFSGGLLFNDFINNVGKKEAWQYILNNGSTWWATLPWMDDGKILWNFIKNKDVSILSSGSVRYTKGTATKGKKEWCIRNLGAKPEVIVTNEASDKQLYCKGPNYILIDDHSNNIKDWQSKGGIGILHTSSSDTIYKLKQILK